MSLRECAPWIFQWQYRYEATASDAEAVRRHFASISTAEAEAELGVIILGEDQPLHVIAQRARGRYWMEVFTAVFNAYPQAAKVKGSYGYLPLHYVARHMGGSEGLQAMQLLLAEYPQAAQEKHKYRDLPIHKLCGNSEATLEMARELLSAYPQGIRTNGSRGESPCEKARYPPADVIEFLHRAAQGESNLTLSIISLPPSSLLLHREAEFSTDYSSSFLWAISVAVVALDLTLRRHCCGAIVALVADLLDRRILCLLAESTQQFHATRSCQSPAYDDTSIHAISG